MRWIVHICLVLLIVSVQGGGAAIADSAIGSGIETTQETTPISTAALSSDAVLEDCCQITTESAINRPAPSPCSSDCFGPLPQAGALAGWSEPVWPKDHDLAVLAGDEERHRRPPRV